MAEVLIGSAYKKLDGVEYSETFFDNGYNTLLDGSWSPIIDDDGDGLSDEYIVGNSTLGILSGFNLTIYVRNRADVDVDIEIYLRNTTTGEDSVVYTETIDSNNEDWLVYYVPNTNWTNPSLNPGDIAFNEGDEFTVYAQVDNYNASDHEENGNSLITIMSTTSSTEMDFRYSEARKNVNVDILYNSFTYATKPIIVRDKQTRSEIVVGDFFTEDELWVDYQSDDPNEYITDLGYTSQEVISGTKYDVFFNIQSGFPYFTRSQSVVIPPPPVYDISLVVRYIINANLSTGALGTVKVEAIGTNSPFKYFTEDPTNFNSSEVAAGQDTGVFKNLAPGQYTFYACGTGVSPKFDTSTISVEVVNRQDTSFDFYRTRWRIQYKDFDNETYSVEVKERDYTGLASVEKGTGDPFSVSTRGEGDDVYEQQLLSSNVSLNLISDEFDKFKDIATADEKQFVLEFSKKDGSNYRLKWRGYISPASYSDQLADIPYSVSVSANDRIGDLKGFKFKYGDRESGAFVRGNMSHFNILQICLNKLDLGFGYRIACNLFAESHQVNNRTPLRQTYVNVDYLLNDEGTDVENCDVAVKDILKIYGATLFAWEGYWYVVRHEEWLNERIIYSEFNDNGNLVGGGAWNPRIELKRPDETNRARFIGGSQSRIFTELHKGVILTENLVNRDQGSGNILPLLDASNLKSNGQGFEGWKLVNNDSGLTSRVINKGLNGSFWEIYLSNDKGSDSYLETTGYIDYDAGDQVEIEVKARIEAFIQPGIRMPNNPPYVRLKWSLKIGDKWLSRFGVFFDEEIINTEFVESFNDFVTISKEVNLEEDQVNISGDYYVFRVYPIDFEESDRYQIAAAQGFDLFGWETALTYLESHLWLTTHMKSIPTVGLPVGSRYVFYATDYNVMYFYELTISSENDYWRLVVPADQDSNGYARKTWKLITNFDIPQPTEQVRIGDLDYTVQDVGWDARTIFEDIKLNYQTTGLDKFPDEIETPKLSNDKNYRYLEYDVSQFDLTTFLNSDKITLNYLKDDNLLPTANWGKREEATTRLIEGSIDSIQGHLLSWLTYLSTQCRAKLSGSFRTDGLNFEPINVLYDPRDNNRVYLPTGVQSNYKLQEYSGELLEIGSDEGIEIEAFSSGFSNGLG